MSLNYQLLKENLHSNYSHQRDEKTIDEEVKGYEKIHGIGYELTTRLKHQIISIDGDTKRASINHFVDNEFLSRDSIAFRNMCLKLCLM